VTNKNCAYCKYCKYCTACSMCSVCEEGGILDRLSTYLSQVKERFGYELDKISSEEVEKELKGLDVEKERKKLKKKAPTKKDEL